MDTKVTHTFEGKHYNRYGMEVVQCNCCANFTPVKQPQCDRCTETVRRIKANPKLARNALHDIGWTCL